MEYSVSDLHPFTLRVTKVEEVKHVKLEAQFAAAEQELRRTDRPSQTYRQSVPAGGSGGCSGGGGSRLLLHGTTPLESIVFEGFKLPETTFWSGFWQSVGLSATRMFGDGIYFTPTSTKAALCSNLAQKDDTEITLLLRYCWETR